MSPPKKKYGALLAMRLEPEFRERLEKIAQEEERTASQMARILLRRAIEEWTREKSRKKSRRSG